MKQGFIRCAAMTPHITVADCSANENEIIRPMNEAELHKANVVVFPEICITGYTCQDLFLQDTLINAVSYTHLRAHET